MGSNLVIWSSDRCRRGSWSTVRQEECASDQFEALEASTEFGFRRFRKPLANALGPKDGSFSPQRPETPPTFS